MSSEFRNVSLIDALQNVVSFVQTDGKPYFRYGHIIEITNILRSLSKDKYPLIILRLDVTGAYNQKLKTFDYENVIIYIVNHSEQHYTAEQRKVYSFENVLTPIYESFINAFKKSRSINNSEHLPFIAHKKTERYFWGSELNSKNTQNVVGDFLDAIEINFSKISIKNINC